MLDERESPPGQVLRNCAERFIASEPIRVTGRRFFMTRRRTERVVDHAFAEHELWRQALRRADEGYLTARGWRPIESAEQAWYGIAWVVETLVEGRSREALDAARAYLERALAAESPEELNDVGFALFSVDCPSCGLRVLKTWGVCDQCGASLA